MRNHTYLLDHHQRSHYDKITNGPEGMMNWVLQLINSQSVNSFNSRVEKFNMQRSPNQPNQNPKPICDRSGKLYITEDALVVQGETSRSHNIDEKGLHEELGSSGRSGKPDKLSENIRVERAHDGTGQLVEQNSSSAHTVKEQFAPEESRDIVSFNTDNEFNGAINEENIDFNIPGVPNSTVKRSHGVNVRNFDSEDREPASATCTSTRPTKQLETLNCVNYSMWNPKHSAKHVCRAGTSASSAARAVTSYEMTRKRTRSTSSSLLTSFRFPIIASKQGDPTATATERKKGITSTSSRICSKRNARREISWVSERP